MQDYGKSNRQITPVAIRLFFVDEKTGNPIPGLVAGILSDSSKSAGPQKAPTLPGKQRQQLASLQTDRAGYVSFKLDRSTLAAGSQIAVTHGVSQADLLILNVNDLLAGNDTHTIHLDASAYAAINLSGLPAVMLPDVKDLSLSPGSIGLIPQLASGGGLCSQLMPTTMGVRRFQAFHVLADICKAETLSCLNDAQVVNGTLLEYEIAWYSVGTSLGDLLNSMTLAPCEQVNLAIADWTRRETASQTQATDVQQQSFQEMNHDRLIVETMQSSVNNKSSSWAVGGSLGLSVPIKGIDITAAFGGAVSSSTTATQVALTTTNQLSEHITQAASFVASQRSSVVFQATASEQQIYQTRTVRNHNHCHTLTLMYYQINRGYQVVTSFKGSRDLILVKCDNADFDAERAYCNAELLKGVLLDQSLLSCFNELADALFCCELTPVVTQPLMDSVTITFWVKENINNTSGYSLILNLASGPPVFSQPPQIWQWQPGSMHSVTVSLPTPVNPNQMVSIVLYGGFGGTITIFSKIEVTGHVMGVNAPLALYSSQTDTVLDSKNTSFLAWLDGSMPVQQVNKNECIEKSCCIQKLLGHLNCHKRYYNSILWINEDPNERVMRWSCCLKDGQPYSLISQIENDPITLYGDFLVFPVAGSQPVEDPSVPPVSNLVSMPTPGVYAEGILGRCDTCEKIDPDRFRDWKDSPCPDNAPAVGSPPAPQADTKPGDLKADTISNLITLSSVPAAPDSIIKDLVSELVSKADGGSSEAKDLLTSLLDTIKEKLTKGSG